MDGFLQQRRQHVKWCIEQEPTTVTIRRTGRIRSGGGYEEIDAQLPAFRARLFKRRSVEPVDVAGVAGEKQVNETWSMLCDHLADVQAGPAVKDQFAVPGVGSFEVTDTFPTFAKGELVSTQCALDLIR